MTSRTSRAAIEPPSSRTAPVTQCGTFGSRIELARARDGHRSRSRGLVRQPFVDMKICRFGDDRYGIVRDGAVYDISSHVERIAGSGRLRRGDPAIAHLGAIAASVRDADLGAPVGTVDAVSFLAPVLFPTKIIAAPVNYEAHIVESEADPGITFNHAVARIDKAGLFLKSTSSLVGAGEGVAVRFPDRRTDHEIELGLVIGRECSDVSESRALVVAGYAIALDMSVRGTEDRSFRKSIDTYSVLGPWLVTADEIADPNDLNFVLTVNGAVRQDANTRRLIFNVQKLIAWASRWYTLYPGDVLMTGTPEGVGPVGPGDVMHCRMDGIGEMSVNVRAAAEMSAGSHAAEAVAG
jgi:2-keto-4-pentenoate hydratase/2-oxohepta-3-ene-1,7-dioic acid hydratase in catechol pathway